PRLVVGSKADVARYDHDGLIISAVTGEGLPQLLHQLAKLITEAREIGTEAEPDTVVVLRPEEEGVRVERESNGAFRVTGKPAERVVALSDVTTPDALAYVHGRLRRLGVDRALARAGARAGDTVHIGGMTFEYEAD